MGNGQSPIDQVDQAISVGFDHIGKIYAACNQANWSTSWILDTAQAYKNESEVGTAIRESGLKREEIYVTTKYSGLDGLDVQASFLNSLKKVSSAFLQRSFC